MHQKMKHVALVIAATVTALSPGTAQAALQKKVQLASNHTATVRWSYPALYVVGTAFDGNTFVAQDAPDHVWRWGYLGGDVHACVWIQTAHVSSGGAATQAKCPRPNHDTAEQFKGPNVGQAAEVWTNKKGNDGLPATLDPNKCGGSERRYANASPLAEHSRLVHPMGPPITKPIHVLKRYLSHDRTVIMVHDTTAGGTGGYPSDWFFVRAACIT